MQIEFLRGIDINIRQASCISVVMSGKNEVSPLKGTHELQHHINMLSAHTARENRMVHDNNNKPIFRLCYHPFEPSVNPCEIMQVLQSISVDSNDAHVFKVNVISCAFKVNRAI